MKGEPISTEFLRRSAVEVAHDLIGCMLCKRQANGFVERHFILETEAYLNEQDLASHARFGKTKRNAIMFQEAGFWYIYLCYGIHFLLNIVVDRVDYPSAVLIRGIKDWMGPGKLTKLLHIDLQQNGMPCEPSTGLWIETISQKFPIHILSTPRIGVDYAGPIWSKKEFRFVGEFSENS